MATKNTQSHGHGETCDLSKSRFLQTWPESSCALQKGKMMCSNWCSVRAPQYPYIDLSTFLFHIIYSLKFLCVYMVYLDYNHP